MKGALQALEANGNRLREGLRVVEEAARFVWNDQRLAGEIRRLRHETVAWLRELERRHGSLIRYRNSGRDPGRHTGLQRLPRTDLRSILTANCHRIQEAARVFEEYGAWLSPTIVKRVHQFRFRVYDLEHALLERCRPRCNPSLYVIIDAATLGANRSPLFVAREALLGGCTMLQWRDTIHTARDSFRIASALSALAGRHGIPLIVNNRADVALLSGAQGLHVGQDDVPVEALRESIPQDWLVGLSSHSWPEAKAGLTRPVDYLSVGPVFATSTKIPHAPPVSLELLRKVVRHAEIPVVAIGGISLDRARAVMSMGVDGIAVASSVCLATNVRKTTGEYAKILSRSKTKSKRSVV